MGRLAGIWFPLSQNTTTHTRAFRRHADGANVNTPTTSYTVVVECTTYRMENVSQIDVVCIYSIVFHIICLIIDKLLKQHQHTNTKYRPKIATSLSSSFKWIHCVCVCTHFSFRSTSKKELLKNSLCKISTKLVAVSRISKHHFVISKIRAKRTTRIRTAITNFMFQYNMYI